MVDENMIPMNIGFGCVVNGTVNYTIEHTFDDLRDSTITPTWFPHPFIAAQTTSKDGNYTIPITAYRINIASGSGSVTMTSLQGMHP